MSILTTLGPEEAERRIAALEHELAMVKRTLGAHGDRLETAVGHLAEASLWPHPDVEWQACREALGRWIAAGQVPHAECPF